jgi:hypothetical protein
MNNKPGCWWLISKTDNSWNSNGSSPWVGGFVMPQECKDRIYELKQLFNEDPPDDLEWGYMKD